MTFDSTSFIHRPYIETELSNYLLEPHRTASMCFLRGRRRIGKSTLLQQLHGLFHIPVFVFTGGPDEKEAALKKRWISEWCLFFPQSQLNKMKLESLHWRDLFFEFAQFGKQTKTPFCICIDEIQWIAKGQTGFVSQLKEAWLKLESVKNLKLILSGSSNKFFHQFTGGEEQILRGLCTHNDIWLKDLRASLLKKTFTPQWKEEEVLFACMCLGGVPYYWQQIPENENFIQAFNRACFTSSSFTLKEAGEILRLEFNKAGVSSASLLLGAIGFGGKTLDQIEKATRLPHSSTSILIEKLLDYGLLKTVKDPYATPRTTSRGLKYFIQDPFLNFYFQVILSLKGKINRNQTGELIFTNIITSKKGFYIQGFTGYAFENFISRLLETSDERSEKIFKLLGIKNSDFEVGTIKQQDRQIDIVLFNTTDRKDKWIECRWTQDTQEISTLIDDIPKKIRGDESPELFIATNIIPTAALLRKAAKQQIRLIGIADLL